MNIVMEAYTKVNEEFNKMMGTLLPESAARLVAVNQNDLSQGLNVCDVYFIHYGGRASVKHICSQINCYGLADTCPVGWCVERIFE